MMAEKKNRRLHAIDLSKTTIALTGNFPPDMADANLRALQSVCGIPADGEWSSDGEAPSAGTKDVIRD
jgi:hypothetical protein